MEELDEPLAIEIKNEMKHSKKAMIVSAGTYNASQMTEVLRSLELLITSRYHAGVLSMKNSVPQIGIGHDHRLKGLYKDMKIEKELLIDYPGDNSKADGIWEGLSKKVDHLIENPNDTRELIGSCYQKQLELSLNNKKFLKKFLFEHEDVMV
jgi:polysaccharide pyruvyl transferase WcaK-like protein